MDDSALTHQLKQGNQLAFTILYDTYSEQVYRLAFKYLCNKELAEDAVQNLFMKVWIKRTSLDESRPLNHFLFTVLKNDLLTILRDPKNHIFVLDDCLELLERIAVALGVPVPELFAAPKEGAITCPHCGKSITIKAE